MPRAECAVNANDTPERARTSGLQVHDLPLFPVNYGRTTGNLGVYQGSVARARFAWHRGIRWHGRSTCAAAADIMDRALAGAA